MEQEIEKEALEVTGTNETEEEDTTLADIEGRFSKILDRLFFIQLFQMALKKTLEQIILN